jgi:hypothetical protein
MAAKKTAKKQAAISGAKAAGPVATRPRIPPEYGFPKSRKGLLPWSHATGKMREAQHYWICTVGAGGRPHATPIDGIWLDDRLYFGGSPATLWRRNLAANPAVCLHLESTVDVLTLRGDAREEPVDASLGQRLADASNQKYGYGQKPEDYVKSGVLVFRPRVVIGWTNLGKDATKWEVAE